MIGARPRVCASRRSVVRRSESRRRRSSEISLTNARSQSARLWRIFMAGGSDPGRDGGLALGALVDRDEAQVVLGDLAGAGGALDLAVDVGLERVPPDRAPDGESDEAVDGAAAWSATGRPWRRRRRGRGPRRRRRRGRPCGPGRRASRSPRARRRPRSSRCRPRCRSPGCSAIARRISSGRSSAS